MGFLENGSEEAHLLRMSLLYALSQGVEDGCFAVFSRVLFPAMTSTAHRRTMKFNGVWIGWFKATGYLIEFLLNPVSLSLEYGQSSENEEPLSRIADAPGLIRVEEVHARTPM